MTGSTLGFLKNSLDDSAIDVLSPAYLVPESSLFVDHF